MIKSVDHPQQEPECFPVMHCPKCREEAWPINHFKVSCEYCEDTFDLRPYLDEPDEYEKRCAHEY